MKTTELIVSGRVQGVGFRNYVSQIAKDLDVKGNVRNLSDGDVKIIVQTDDDTLNKMVEQIKQPQHHFMKIKDVAINELQLDKVYDDFSVVY
ncbi:acylphosphatase [Aerococcaceae bacterium INB8]|uniref:acylphosphatase n=1 Tax=Ruoffia halotolerans TaxID=2748684 RepID=A0A839A5R6_9LACT|nr:acylphosphatase [Ruoffia halotolerans]MBA5729043.1 acylphosphatase [Ruoffia halotolerans]